MTSLYERLGRTEGIRALVDTVATAHVANPIIGKRFLPLTQDPEHMAVALRHLCHFLEAGAGGPAKYTGKSMKEVHKGMDITDAEVDASVDDLVKAMEKNGVKDEEIKAVRTAVEGTRKDIVTKKE